jgi:hypothetical protein
MNRADGDAKPEGRFRMKIPGGSVYIERKKGKNIFNFVVVLGRCTCN